MGKQKEGQEGDEVDEQEQQLSTIDAPRLKNMSLFESIFGDE
jgi:hypothetical protein